MQSMRLVIDARMLDHSGIGVYLSHVLPGIIERCAPLDPLVLASPEAHDRAKSLVATKATVAVWSAAPLSVRELLPPPHSGPGTLWWVPHYNVPLFSRAPLVATVHDVLPLSSAAGHWPLAKRLAVKSWIAAIRARARRVVCSSDFTRREVIRLARIDESRIDVVPLGVDIPGTVAPAPIDDGAKPYLLFVGLVKPHKNLSGLLRAFEAVSGEIAHRLIVVGRHTGLRDVDSAALEQAARLAPRVELLEDIPRERLAALMAGAALLIQPSFYEGFGLPPLEAMAAGTPVLAASAGALPEVCGDAALYFDPASPREMAQRIREALGDEGLRDRLRERGRERVRAFTWEACAARTGDILLAAAQPAIGM